MPKLKTFCAEAFGNLHKQMRLLGLLHKIIGKLLKAAVGGDTDIPMHRVSAAESLPDKLSSETASCWSCTLTMLQETSFGPRSLAKFKEACLPSPCPNGATPHGPTRPGPSRRCGVDWGRMWRSDSKSWAPRCTRDACPPWDGS